MSMQTYMEIYKEAVANGCKTVEDFVKFYNMTKSEK